MMEILYKVHNNLYVNLTNKCSSACTFCLRQTKETVGESKSLWLEREPSAEEVKAEFSKWKVEDFDEIVFCGFGEPTYAVDVMTEVADFIKKTYGKNIRLNTNGQGNLINERNIVPELVGRIDTISISLNNPDAEKYQEIVRSKFGTAAFDAMLDFAREAAKVISKVVLSTVDTTITHEEEDKCRKICEEIGAVYRIRPFE